MRAADYQCCQGQIDPVTQVNSHLADFVIIDLAVQSKIIVSTGFRPCDIEATALYGIPRYPIYIRYSLNSPFLNTDSTSTVVIVLTNLINLAPRRLIALPPITATDFHSSVTIGRPTILEKADGGEILR